MMTTERENTLPERENTRRRICEVRVKLQPEMAARLDEIAKRRGVPSATLAALVLGEFVERYDQNQNYHQAAVMEVARLMVVDLGPKFDEVIEQLSKGNVSDVFSLLASPNPKTT